LYSAQDISAKGIQKYIVEVNTTQPCVKRIQILQQIPPYAEETIRIITKAATFVKTYKKQETKQ
jgi:hypothetical protein